MPNKKMIDEDLIDELLNRSVAEILPSKESLKKELLSGRKLKIYIGADATGPALHLGHATNYMILEKFRRLGHKVVILIGDFTARIGDPTDKTAARVQLTRPQVIKNTKTWLKQLAPIISIKDKKNPVAIVYNHDWLSKLKFEDILDISSNFTVQQMIERDMFEKRLREEKPIFLHEFMYPLMQGYDSVHLNVDIEMCGNDQKFNALAGRTLLHRYRNKEKFVFITTLLENPVTKEKMMSKSLGTGVYLNASPKDMYGKIMAQPDENIPQLFTDCTFLSLQEVDKIKNDLRNSSVNPRDIKMRLALEVTKIYHGEKYALSAQDNFRETFSKKNIVAENLPVVSVRSGSKVSEGTMATLVVKSNSEAWRLIRQGGVELNGKTLKDPNEVLSESGVLRVGKKNFFRLEIK